MINYHIPNHDGKNYESNNTGFSALDYNLPIDELNISEIHLSKRYPTEGFVLNAKSRMIVRILEGGVTFTSEDESVFLPKGSVVLVDTNKKYAWEPKPEVSLYIVSTPPWTAEQAEVIAN
jgi:mannose-6-phosphate isomerase class I